jgi:hypothetical protein
MTLNSIIERNEKKKENTKVLQELIDNYINENPLINIEEIKKTVDHHAKKENFIKRLRKMKSLHPTGLIDTPKGLEDVEGFMGVIRNKYKTLSPEELIWATEAGELEWITSIK